MHSQRPWAADADSAGNAAAWPSPATLPTLPARKKKPGPKRDAKPAPNEKLERNRQAQRSHRERKEQYTKDLELEVMRLKELFVQTTRERDDAIQFWEVADRAPLASTHRLSIWDTEETRGFASDGPISDAPARDLPVVACPRSSNATASVTVTRAQELPAGELDYDELGLDFILTLERPCMGHIHYLHVRAHNYQPSEDGGMGGQPMEVPDDGENQHISGHAMMATAPLYTDIIERPGSRYPCQLPQLKRQDLVNLLNLSAALEISEPEVPPVRAWIRLMQDSRTRGFSAHDFEVLKTSLLNKIHCYRFGAIIDEHDIDDALTQVCQVKEAAAVAAASPAANAQKLEP
ncbi:hypothetical protein BST61_g1712 [Cercospora zeina]